MKKFNITFYVLLTSIFLNMLVLKVQAQELPLELSWEKGTVILNSGDTVRGNVVLTTPRDMIRISNINIGTRFYSPADVNSFYVSGLIKKNGFSSNEWAAKRGYDFQFQTFPWNMDREYSNFIAPAFFVVIRPGNYSLLIRLVKETDRASGVVGSSIAGAAAGYGARKIAESIIKEKMYLRSPENKIIALRKPKEDLKRIFAKNFKQIDDYAQTYNLRYNNTTDLAQIIGFANALNP